MDDVFKGSETRPDGAFALIGALSVIIENSISELQQQAKAGEGGYPTMEFRVKALEHLARAQFLMKEFESLPWSLSRGLK